MTIQYPQYQPPPQRSGTGSGCLLGGLIVALFFIVGVPLFFLVMFTMML